MVGLAEEHPSVALVGAFRLAGSELDLDGVVPSRASVVSAR